MKPLGIGHQEQQLLFLRSLNEEIFSNLLYSGWLVCCYLAGWPARLPDWCLQAIGWMTCTPADLHAGARARLPTCCCWCRCCLLAGESASHFFFGPPTELSRVNTHSDYQPWQYNNGNGMLALKTPAILRPKIEKAKQNELFPLLSNERQLSTKNYLANQFVVIIRSI